MFVVKQANHEFWEHEKPAFVHRADKSPNFGVRVFEQVAVFTTKAQADAWIKEQA